MHSHNYTPAQAYKRSFGEGRALAAIWPGKPGDFSLTHTVLSGWVNDARRDLRFCVRARRLSEWPHALFIRWRQRCARLAGFNDGWKAYREDAATGSIQPPTWERFQGAEANR
jgi:rhamnosyltransferase